MINDFKIATMIISSNTYPAIRNSKMQKNILLIVVFLNLIRNQMINLVIIVLVQNLEKLIKNLEKYIQNLEKYIQNQKNKLLDNILFNMKYYIILINLLLQY